jgi:hypothetical protein
MTIGVHDNGLKVKVFKSKYGHAKSLERKYMREDLDGKGR